VKGRITLLYYNVEVFMSANRTGNGYAKVLNICDFCVQWDRVKCKDWHLTACRKKGKQTHVLHCGFCTFFQ